MYLEYDEYKAMTGATISEADYPVYEDMAETIVDAYTFSVLKRNGNALSVYGEKVKRAMVYQLSLMGSYKSLEAYSADNAEGVQSRSVTVGGTSESVTYKANGNDSSNVYGMKIAPLAKAVLAPVRACGRVIA